MKQHKENSATSRLCHTKNGGQAKAAFQKFARLSSRAAGHPAAFGIAVGVLLLWALMGPIFGFSDSWQLIINTATTIVTFLMVFLIQNTQNRDCEAMQLKLDELIRATQSAHNALLNIEELSEAELDQIKRHYERLAQKAGEALRAGRSDLGRPDMGNNQRTASSRRWSRKAWKRKQQ